MSAKELSELNKFLFQQNQMLIKMIQNDPAKYHQKQELRKYANKKIGIYPNIEYRLFCELGTDKIVKEEYSKISAESKSIPLDEISKVPLFYVDIIYIHGNAFSDQEMVWLQYKVLTECRNCKKLIISHKNFPDTEWTQKIFPYYHSSDAGENFYSKSDK